MHQLSSSLLHDEVRGTSQDSAFVEVVKPLPQCPCCVGPFKHEDRGELHEQYELYCQGKDKPTTVSEHSNPGVGNLTDMAQVALQVSIIQYILFLSLYVLVVISSLPSFSL